MHYSSLLRPWGGRFLSHLKCITDGLKAGDITRRAKLFCTLMAVSCLKAKVLNQLLCFRPVDVSTLFRTQIDTVFLLIFVFYGSQIVLCRRGSVHGQPCTTEAYAPHCIQKLSLEWLFRLCLEPRRLWKRYLKQNSRFVWYFLQP